MNSGFGGGSSKNWYDVAQICLNGHVVNSSTKAYPEHSTNFCSKCGKATITACEKCNSEIRGKYHVPMVFGGGYDKPNFCISCGIPYPWTESALAAASALTDEIDEMSAQERDLIKANFKDLVEDNPKTPVAASRIKKFLAGPGREIGEGLKTVLIDVISETAKRMIWPNP